MNDDSGTTTNVEQAAYSSQSDAVDSVEYNSVPVRPLRVGPDARNDSFDTETDSTARDVKTCKGPFIYTELV